MPSIHATHRRAALGALAMLAVLVSACHSPSAVAPINAPGGPASATPPGAMPSPAGSAPAPVEPSSVATLPPASPDAWLAVGRKGVPGFSVILASTRELMFDLPAGVPDDRWGRIVVAEVQLPEQQSLPRLDGPATLVSDLAGQPRFPIGSTRVDGAWRLPTVGPDPIPVGLSGDGQTIVLVPTAEARNNATSRFVVLRRDLAGAPRLVSLSGRFDYDALSPDGKTLYVVEHLDAEVGGRYQVRAVDLPTGKLREGVIVDKRNIDEAMAGYPLSQVRRTDGLVLTLYRGIEHPFIHLLNSVDAWAVCIDLPATGAGDVAAAADWGLAPSPDGRSVYAVNATLGLIEDLDPTGLGVRRSSTVKPLAGSGIALAKFGHQDSGPTGRRVVVGPDGRTIYAAGAGGILAIDTASLKINATFLAGRPVDALAVTPDGGIVYALLRDRGRIVKLDAASGELLATVPGDGYDRLVAVVPW